MITDITPTGAAFTAFPRVSGTVSFGAVMNARVHTAG